MTFAVFMLYIFCKNVFHFFRIFATETARKTFPTPPRMSLLGISRNTPRVRIQSNLLTHYHSHTHGNNGRCKSFQYNPFLIVQRLLL